MEDHAALLPLCRHLGASASSADSPAAVSRFAHGRGGLILGHGVMVHPGTDSSGWFGVLVTVNGQLTSGGAR
jgi:hypothetical protein